MARAGSARHQRIESQMRRSLAQLLGREVKDPRVGNVTVTEVTLSPDLSEARVYVMPFAMTPAVPGAPHDAAAAAAPMLEGLRHAAGFLRGEVGRQLQLRHAPRLEFVLDETLDRAAQLTALIDSVKRDT